MHSFFCAVSIYFSALRQKYTFIALVTSTCDPTLFPDQYLFRFGIWMKVRESKIWQEEWMFQRCILYFLMHKQIFVLFQIVSVSSYEMISQLSSTVLHTWLHKIFHILLFLYICFSVDKTLRHREKGDNVMEKKFPFESHQKKIENGIFIIHFLAKKDYSNFWYFGLVDQ